MKCLQIRPETGKPMVTELLILLIYEVGVVFINRVVFYIHAKQKDDFEAALERIKNKRPKKIMSGDDTVSPKLPIIHHFNV